MVFIDCEYLDAGCKHGSTKPLSLTVYDRYQFLAPRERPLLICTNRDCYYLVT